MKKNIQEGVKYYLICGLEGVPGSLFHQGLDVIAAHVDPVVEIAAPKHVVVTEKGQVWSLTQFYSVDLS